MKSIRKYILKRSDQSATLDPSRDSKNTNDEDIENKNFFSDVPISNPDLDLFRRWPFSKRIAQTISLNTDNSGLVIGIYGSWGEGKTTVLRFIEENLKEEANTVCVSFNTWRYPSEDQLIKQLYQKIAQSLKSSLEKFPERLGRKAKEYEEFFNLFEGASVAKGIIKILDSVTPEKYKDELEKLLSEKKLRVVILMDDIDRLNRQEIQSVFRLVKLSADFKYTTYVLAFDEEAVAEALGEQYGDGKKESGKRFLEKIITVPLRLPEADKFALRKLCFEGITLALSQSKIELAETDLTIFLNLFDSILMPRLRTPRIIKRYINAVLFAMPMIKDEAYPVDIMFIEGLRVCYEQVYNLIKENPDVFLGSTPDKDRATEIVQRILNSMPIGEKNAMVKVLRDVFPGLQSSLESTLYNESGALIKAKRIGSRYYFYRYFSYSVSDTDIRDLDFNTFLDSTQNSTMAISSSLLGKITKEGNAENIFARLYSLDNISSPRQAINIAVALSRNGKMFDGIDTITFPSGRYMTISKYICDLILSIPTQKDKFTAAKIVAITSNPIFLAVEFMRWIGNPRYKPDDKFSEEHQNFIGKIVASRIANLGKEILIYEPKQDYATSLLWTWSKYSSKEDVTQYVLKTFQENQDNIGKLLQHYLSFGLFAGALNVRDRYEELELVIDTRTIYQFLLSVYGDSLKSPNLHDDIDNKNNAPTDLRLIHIFSYLYQQSISTGE